jgi:hypothetical protein
MQPKIALCIQPPHMCTYKRRLQYQDGLDERRGGQQRVLQGSCTQRQVRLVRILGQEMDKIIGRGNTNYTALVLHTCTRVQILALARAIQRGASLYPTHTHTHTHMQTVRAKSDNGHAHLRERSAGRVPALHKVLPDQSRQACNNGSRHLQQQHSS